MKFLVMVFLYYAFSGPVKCAKAGGALNTCNFSAIFNFGDSNSDTGGAYTYYHSIHWPNGMTVGKLFKRNGDGRLVIDFLAESLGFPYLNASADTNGTSFRYGANFAVGGETIYPVTDHHLDEQVSRFFDFKSRAIASKEPECSNIYPKSEAFPEALYTIDIGQNDVANTFHNKPVSTTLDYFTKSVQRLLNDGAKYLWVHNTCPLGCFPVFVELLEAGMLGFNYTRDNNGCIEFLDKRSQLFNSELKLRTDLLAKQYPAAVITLVDMYSAKYQLVANPQGFDGSLRFKNCCGNMEVSCGQTATVGNKTVFGGACNNPSKYLSWDSIHWTEAANMVLAQHISSGLSQACRKLIK